MLTVRDRASVSPHMPEKPDKNPVNGPNMALPSASQMESIQALAWPDVWATSLKLEVDAHPFDIRGREYERDILRDESQFICVPKGAQLGFTTLFILKSCHAIVMRGKHVLYLLPLKAGSVQFVQGRIDPIMDSNKNLAKEFSRTDNRAQKQTTRGTNWYIRGTNIHTELREIPADILVIDERDKANEGNLDDAYARLNGSTYNRIYELSTPTIEGHGVYGPQGWDATDKMRWWVPCPHCGSRQVINFDENVLPHLGDTAEDSADSCRCTHCHKVLTDDDRANMNAGGQWVPDEPGMGVRGYHLSQFNSPTMQLATPRTGILVNYFAGQYDSLKLKSFFNLALGLPYTAPGEKFSVELLDRCRLDYSMGGIPDGALRIGIDVGHDVLYVSIWVTKGYTRRLWKLMLITPQGSDNKWAILERDVLQSLDNWICVCDAHPDKEEVEALSKKYPGRFWMGFEKDRTEQEATAKFSEVKWGDPAKVNIDRTMAFDSLIKSYMDGNSFLPRDARELGEWMPKLGYNGFYHQHLMMTRVEQADTSERLIARWVNGKVSTEGAKKASAKSGNRPDHWHHSDMFALVAGMKQVPMTIPTEIGNVLRAAGGLIGARG